jgi:muramidase (phage lysozyme)
VKKLALIGAAGLLAYGAWRLNQGSKQGQDTSTNGGGWLGNNGDILASAAQDTAEFLDVATMGILKLSNMRSVGASDVANRNVQAFLQVLRNGEGTAGPNGYRTLFGGGLFEGFATHPNIKVTRTMGGRALTSTAAGAYQFLKSTWDETARIMGLRDFSPGAQDLGAVGRIAARGALDDVKAGRFDVAIFKVAKEWASMPGSPYGQPVISLTRARGIYANAGGAFA